MRKIKDIFEGRGSITNEIVTPEMQQKTILRYLLKVYLWYLAAVIKEQLSEYFGDQYKSKRIGYTITVEKLVLDGFVGTKEDMRTLISQGGLLWRPDDTSNNLMLLIEGEEEEVEVSGNEQSTSAQQTGQVSK